MSDRAPLANPGVRFPPPVLFAAGVAAGWLLDRFLRPLPFPIDGELLEWLGVSLASVGLAMLAWGVLTFRAARTAVVPTRAANRLVAGGPYRFTRNPMYVGLTLLYVGVAALLDSAWPLLALPIVLALLVRLVIRREEAYLADAFGADYAAYRTRVRRWM